MATIVELGPDDVLVVRIPRDLDEGEYEAFSGLRDMIGCRAVFVLAVGASISSLPADEVLRALAGS
jgi:hypothetical protein